MSKADYWHEALSIALEGTPAFEVFWALDVKVRDEIAGALATSAEHESEAFYTPPSSDRYVEIDREWKRKYDALKADFERYQGHAETAVKQALRQRRDANVAIGEHGEVRLFNGRSDRIQ